MKVVDLSDEELGESASSSVRSTPPATHPVLSPELRTRLIRDVETMEMSEVRKEHQRLKESKALVKWSCREVLMWLRILEDGSFWGFAEPFLCFGDTGVTGKVLLNSTTMHDILGSAHQVTSLLQFVQILKRQNHRFLKSSSVKSRRNQFSHSHVRGKTTEDLWKSGRPKASAASGVSPPPLAAQSSLTRVMGGFLGSGTTPAKRALVSHTYSSQPRLIQEFDSSRMSIGVGYEFHSRRGIQSSEDSSEEETEEDRSPVFLDRSQTPELCIGSRSLEPSSIRKLHQRAPIGRAARHTAVEPALLDAPGGRSKSRAVSELSDATGLRDGGDEKVFDESKDSGSQSRLSREMADGEAYPSPPRLMSGVKSEAVMICASKTSIADFEEESNDSALAGIVSVTPRVRRKKHKRSATSGDLAMRSTHGTPASMVALSRSTTSRRGSIGRRRKHAKVDSVGLGGLKVGPMRGVGTVSDGRSGRKRKKSALRKEIDRKYPKDPKGLAKRLWNQYYRQDWDRYCAAKDAGTDVHGLGISLAGDVSSSSPSESSAAGSHRRKKSPSPGETAYRGSTSDTEGLNESLRASLLQSGYKHSRKAVIMEGWLYKRGYYHTKFVKRFCILTSEGLFLYFKDRPTVGDVKISPLGCVDVTRMSEECMFDTSGVSDAELDKHPNQFSLKIGRRNWRLACPTSVDFPKWMAQINILYRAYR